jgi:regulator of PEP synthase PpsR (kinase-PPPase family)
LGLSNDGGLTINTKDDGPLMKSPTTPIYIVSGGTGASAQHLVDTVLVQFPGSHLQVITITSVRQIEQIEDVVAQAATSGGTIVHTLVNSHLRNSLIRLSQKRNVVSIDLMGTLLSRLSEVLGKEPVARPGLYRQLHQDYFERVAAIEFTMTHDDGMNPKGWSKAEIMIVGVSRVGKTPLSIYLSVLGWKVANLPVILGLPLEKELFQLDPRRIIGLDIDPSRLLIHRRQRLKRMGELEPSAYIDQNNINDELEAARQVFKQVGASVINVTDNPIESSANEVIELITKKLKAESHKK